MRPGIKSEEARMLLGFDMRLRERGLRAFISAN
jgi:hypothetical protein